MNEGAQVVVAAAVAVAVVAAVVVAAGERIGVVVTAATAATAGEQGSSQKGTVDMDTVVKAGQRRRKWDKGEASSQASKREVVQARKEKEGKK